MEECGCRGNCVVMEMPVLYLSPMATHACTSNALGQLEHLALKYVF